MKTYAVTSPPVELVVFSDRGIISQSASISPKSFTDYEDGRSATNYLSCTIAIRICDRLMTADDYFTVQSLLDILDLLSDNHQLETVTTETVQGLCGLTFDWQESKQAFLVSGTMPASGLLEVEDEAHLFRSIHSQFSFRFMISIDSIEKPRGELRALVAELEAHSISHD